MLLEINSENIKAETSKLGFPTIACYNYSIVAACEAIIWINHLYYYRANVSGGWMLDKKMLLWAETFSMISNESLNNAILFQVFMLSSIWAHNRKMTILAFLPSCLPTLLPGHMHQRSWSPPMHTPWCRRINSCLLLLALLQKKWQW